MITSPPWRTRSGSRVGRLRHDARATSTSTPAALKGGATKAKKQKPKSAIGLGRRDSTCDAERWTVSFPKRGRNQIPRREARAFPLEPSPLQESQRLVLLALGFLSVRL